MCLTTRFPFIKTKKPIFCYKVVRKDYTSQYQKFPYELNKLYVLNFNLTAECGLTSIISIFPKELWTTFSAQYNCRYIGGGRELVTSNFLHLKVVNHGFHAYRNLECAITLAKLSNRLIIVKCVIPEGSTIGINYNEIVSNQIAIIEQVKYD